MSITAEPSEACGTLGTVPELPGGSLPVAEAAHGTRDGDAVTKVEREFGAGCWEDWAGG